MKSFQNQKKLNYLEGFKNNLRIKKVLLFKGFGKIGKFLGLEITVLHQSIEKSINVGLKLG
jgi:hypothetical protein